jgi:hypothetical protein
MAIACEFIDIIIPFAKIEAVYRGGFTAFKEEWGFDFYHDEHLVREGAMSPADAEYVVKEWERRGLKPFKTLENGEKAWDDLCVIESIFSGGPTLPCDWIEFDARERCAWLKGHAKGEIARFTPKERKTR